jgi:hypothetical protein
MVGGFNINMSLIANDKATPKITKNIIQMAQKGVKATQNLNASINKTGSFFERLNSQVRKVSETINKQFGGRMKNAGGQMNNFGQNLSSISNRLGFMAFQWNFMANAANRAVDTVIGGLSRIITEGAKTSDAVVRALAFGTGIDGIRNQTAEATKDLEILHNAIFAEGSGKSIFGVDVVANISKEIAKAFPDSIGSQEIANILPFATQLKSIEPALSDEKLGTGLVSLFHALGTDVSNIEEVSAAMDFLSNVSDKSTATFQSSIGSLGVAAQQAKNIGIDAFELGLIIQRVADLNARNKAGGRAAATPGTYSNAFFRDLQAFSDKDTKQGKAAIKNGLDLFIGAEGDPKREFKDLVGIAAAFEKQLEGLGTAARGAKLSELGITVNSQKVLLDLLNKEGLSIEDQLESLKQRGTLEARSAASTVSAQSQILRIQNAISASKSIIAEGFGRALKEIADGLSAITSNSEFKTLLGDIGKILGNQLIPHLKTAFKFAKAFIGFLVKNKKTLRFVIGTVIALSAALAGLAVIATIGFFALVAGSSIFGMAGQMTIASGAAATLGRGLSFVFRTMIPMALAGLGIVLVGLALAGVFDDSLTPAVILLGGALTALGLAFVFPNTAGKIFTKVLTANVGSLTGLKSAITGVGPALSKLATEQAVKGGAINKMLFGTAGSAGGGFVLPVAAVKGITQKVTGLFQSLGKAGPIGAAVAVGAVLILAFVNEMEKKVEGSAIFKTGLVDKWQQVGFRMTAATNVFLRNVAKGFVDIFTGISKGLSQFGEFFLKIMKAIGEAAWYAITNPFDTKGALLKLKQGISDAFGDFSFGNTLKAAFDPTGVTGAVDEIRNSLGALKEGGYDRFDPIVTETLADILDAFQVAPQDFGALPIKAILDEIFGAESFAQIPAQTAAAAAGMGEELTKTTVELTKTEKELKANQELLAGIGKTYVDEAEIKAASNAVIKTNSGYLVENSATTGANTIEILNNTSAVTTDIAVMMTKIDIQKLQILEIAKNINATMMATSFILKVNVMFAQMIASGNAFTRSINSAKMNSKGKWSYTRHGISSGDAGQIRNAEESLRNFQGQARPIDITGLGAELAKLTVVLTTAVERNTGTSPVTTDPQTVADIAAQTAIDAANAAASSTSGGVGFDGGDGSYMGEGGLPTITSGWSDLGNEVYQRYLDYLNAVDTMKSFNTPGAYSISGGGQTVIAAAGENGSTNLDINIDGTFTINVLQGGLTNEQILDLERQIGGALLNQVKEKLGVQA